MSTHPRRQVLGAAAGVAAAAVLPLTSTTAAHAGEPLTEHAGPWAPVPAPVPVPLDSLYDNDGVDTASARGGDFDGSGYTFPGEELPTGRVEVDGTSFVFPTSSAGAKNNVVALGQRVELPKGRYLSAVFLTAGSYGNASGKATVHYADGSTTTATLGGSDWYATGGSLSATYRYAPDGTKDEHRVGIGTSELWLDPQRDAVAVTLPVTNPAQANKASLHVFALSCNLPLRAVRWPCARPGPRTRSWRRPAPRASKPPSSTRGRSPSWPRTACRCASRFRERAPSRPRVSAAWTPVSRPASASASATVRAPPPALPGTAR